MKSEIRFFEVPTADTHADKSATLWPCLAPIRNAAVSYTWPNGKALIKAVIGPEEVALIQEATAMENPLDPQVLTLLGIDDLFIGRTIEDVFLKYPELEGQEQTGMDPETGEPIMVDIVKNPTWCGIG